MFRTIKMPMFNADGAQGGGYNGAISDEQFLAYFEGTDTETTETADEEVIETTEETQTEETETQETETEETETTDQPQTYKVKVDGQEVELTYEDLLAKASAGFNYTRKNTELKSEREKFEQERTGFQEQLKGEMLKEFDPYIQLVQRLQANPQYYQEFLALDSKYAGQLQAPQTPTPNAFDIEQDPRFKQLRDELSETKTYLDEWKVEQQVQSMQKEWDGLVVRFPDAEQMMVQICDFADAKGYDLETAYKALNYENIAKQTQAKIAAQAVKKQTAKTVQPQATGAGSGERQAPRNYKDVWAQIQADGLGG